MLDDNEKSTCRMSGPRVPSLYRLSPDFEAEYRAVCCSVSPVTLGELITSTPGWDLKHVSPYSAVINSTPFGSFFLLH